MANPAVQDIDLHIAWADLTPLEAVGSERRACILRGVADGHGHVVVLSDSG